MKRNAFYHFITGTRDDEGKKVEYTEIDKVETITLYTYQRVDLIIRKVKNNLQLQLLTRWTKNKTE